MSLQLGHQYEDGDRTADQRAEQPGLAEASPEQCWHMPAGGAFIGWFCLRPEAQGPLGEVELGYRLRQAAWGKGKEQWERP